MARWLVAGGAEHVVLTSRRGIDAPGAVELRDELTASGARVTVAGMQAAAGVAGIIKMVLAMRHGVLPRTLHVDEPSPHVDWSAGAVSLLTEQVEWPETGRPPRGRLLVRLQRHQRPYGSGAGPGPRRAGRQHTAEPARTRPVFLVAWPLSAKGEDALRAQAERLRAHLEADTALGPVDVAYSLATTRSALEHRAVVLGPEPDRLLAGLTALARGESSRAADRGR
ncbi:Polyketide synthase OS=Streptomyces antimycoticus OX=68175 GN=SANT12839_037360 PE=4 SV=1 [Streptomyces antimycoticus]